MRVNLVNSALNFSLDSPRDLITAWLADVTFEEHHFYLLHPLTQFSTKSWHHSCHISHTAEALRLL
jgi:hypothetical protein